MTPCKRCGYELLAEDEICPRCGAIVGTLKTPMIIDGRYAVESTLGAGSMGVVHLARDLKLDRRVAIKMIAPEFAAEVEATTRFAREAATLAAIRSENVVRVNAFGKHGSAHFFVMEYVHGRDLDDIVSAYAAHEQYVPIHRVLTILRQVAHGLTAVHAAGIVHRDVKPGNVVIEEDTGRPVLVDFGLARSVDRRSGKRSTVGAGTPWYMAPEQVEDDDEDWGVISPRTDVYGFGCTTFELFTARPPFDSIDADELMSQHLHEEAPLVSLIRPELKRFDGVLARALAKRSARRFESADAFVDALEEAALDEEATGPLSIESMPIGGAARGAVRAMVLSDDDLFIGFASRAMRTAFDGAPFTVNAASSELEASAIAQWNPPQLVVLDGDAADLRHVETLSRLRALPTGTQMRVVVVSETGASERWKFEVVGVRDFVKKPGNISELAGVIAALIARAGWVR